MKATTSNLTMRVSRETKDVVDKRIAGGEFPTSGAMFESLVHDILVREEKSRLEQLLKEGLKGRSRSADAAFWKDLERKAMVRLKGKKGGVRTKR
jgi:hypothetical protein